MFASRGLRITGDDISLVHARHHPFGRVRCETVVSEDGQILSEREFADHGFMDWYCSTFLRNPSCKWSYYRMHMDMDMFRQDLRVDFMKESPPDWKSDRSVGACMYELKSADGRYIPASDFMLDSNPAIFSDLKELFFSHNELLTESYYLQESSSCYI